MDRKSRYAITTPEFNDRGYYGHLIMALLNENNAE